MKQHFLIETEYNGTFTENYFIGWILYGFKKNNIQATVKVYPIKSVKIEEKQNDNSKHSDN